jgi:hypothetical protein
LRIAMIRRTLWVICNYVTVLRDPAVTRVSSLRRVLRLACAGVNADRHHDHDNCDDESDSTIGYVPASDSPPDHDDDAVYVSDEGYFWGRSSVNLGNDGSHSLKPSLNVAASPLSFTGPGMTLCPHPPPIVADSDCPRYLRHLAILI